MRELQAVSSTNQQPTVSADENRIDESIQKIKRDDGINESTQQIKLCDGSVIGRIYILEEQTWRK